MIDDLETDALSAQLEALLIRQRIAAEGARERTNRATLSGLVGLDLERELVRQWDLLWSKTEVLMDGWAGKLTAAGALLAFTDSGAAGGTVASKDVTFRAAGAPQAERMKILVVSFDPGKEIQFRPTVARPLQVSSLDMATAKPQVIAGAILTFMEHVTPAP